ncbi:hypothetical protein AX16_004719 [Volvariella volvacea WC 439]|nr:hypothetical protein AX16_004719 [Volvariella volvacea WC 439]
MFRPSSPDLFRRRFSQQSREHDIARLLDPSYLGTTQRPTNTLYVDAYGELHDPDYRDFPIMSERPPRRRTYTPAHRPIWEQGSTTDDSPPDDYEERSNAFRPRRTSYYDASKRFPNIHRNITPLTSHYRRDALGHYVNFSSPPIGSPSTYSSSFSTAVSTSSTTSSATVSNRLSSINLHVSQDKEKENLKEKEKKGFFGFARRCPSKDSSMRRSSDRVSESSSSSHIMGGGVVEAPSVRPMFDESSYAYAALHHYGLASDDDPIPEETEKERRKREKAEKKEQKAQEKEAKRKEKEENREKRGLDVEPTCEEALKVEWVMFCFRVRIKIYRAEKRVKQAFARVF